MKTCPTKDEFLKQMAKDHGLDANGVAEAARLYDKISGMAEADATIEINKFKEANKPKKVVKHCQSCR